MASILAIWVVCLVFYVWWWRGVRLVPAGQSRWLPARIPEVRAGQVWKWVPDKDRDPWSQDWTVKVVDVRQGWVLYDMGGGSRSSLKLRQFVWMYQLKAD